MMRRQLTSEGWFLALPERVRALVLQAWYLVERERGLFEEGKIVDYGYLVFSAAKAYEGFLKDHFLTLGLIDQQIYEDEYFRIGRALNPDLPRRYRDSQWLYDDVERLCGSGLAQQLWQTWKECRNEVFHFSWQDQEERMYLDVAAGLVEKVIQAMERAQQCEAKVNGMGKS